MGGQPGAGQRQLHGRERGDGEQSITWASRTESSDGKTSPEELIAAAHGSCFAMALSNVLDERGTPPERLEINAVCTFDVDDVKASSVDLDVRGRVPGMDAEDFQNAVEQGDQECPVSNALPYGRHMVRVVAKDTSEVGTTKEWDFRVARP